MAQFRREQYTYATDAYISEGWMGYVSLAPEWQDLSRYEAGVVRMLLHHDAQLATGEIREQWFDAGSGDDPGRYRALVDIPTDSPVQYINNYLWHLDNTKLMDSTSVGFSIDRLELVEVGKTWYEDKLKAAWTWYEFSAGVSSPADVLAAVERSGARRASIAGEEREMGDYYILTRGGRGIGYAPKGIVDQVKVEADIIRQLRRFGGRDA